MYLDVETCLLRPGRSGAVEGKGMNKFTKVILSLLFLTAFLTGCVSDSDYKIIARDGQIYYFTGQCTASKWGDLTVTCYEGMKPVLSIQATYFEVLENE